jgi:hypothetical protein
MRPMSRSISMRDYTAQHSRRQSSSSDIGFNGKFLRFRRDGVSISYTVICLSHFDVCLATTKIMQAMEII